MGFFTNLFTSRKTSNHQKSLRKYASCNDMSKSQKEHEMPHKFNPLTDASLSTKLYGKQLDSTTYEEFNTYNDAQKQSRTEEPSRVSKPSGRCPFDHSNINVVDASLSDLNTLNRCPFDQPIQNPYELPTNSSNVEPTVLEILGEDRVELMVEKFYHYNLTDRKTRVFFQGVNIERLQRMQTTFLVHLLGGKQMNMSKMRAAHKRLLELNDSHFDAVLRNLTRAAKDLGVSSKLRERILAAAETTRDDVLGRIPTYEVAQQRHH